MPPRCCLRPRSQDTGGKKRRPDRKDRTRSSRRTSPDPSARDQLELCASLVADQHAKEGDNCSQTCCPPPFLDAEFVNGLPGDGIRRVARCGGEVSYEWRKGNIRTRVPPSSIDRSAPPSM